MKESITIIILSLLSLILAGCSTNNSGPGKYDSLANCMTANGVVMYGTSWCPHCQNQKKEFGNSFQYINFVDCDANTDACNKAGVQGYPTWAINGTNYPGEQSLYDLANYSGCVTALLNSTPA